MHIVSSNATDLRKTQRYSFPLSQSISQLSPPLLTSRPSHLKLQLFHLIFTFMYLKICQYRYVLILSLSLSFIFIFWHVAFPYGRIGYTLPYVPVKEKIILILVKMVRKTLFRTTVTTVSRLSQQWREIGLISEHSEDSKGVVVKEESERVGGWKITKRKHRR